jgi:hypothetical protein
VPAKRIESAGDGGSKVFMSEPRAVQCPSCGGNDVSSSAHGIARCNQCGSEFLVQTDEPTETDSAGVLAYRAPGAQHADEAELSELQIRYVSNLRRGAYRERSYWIIAAALCLVGAVKLLQIGLATWWRGWILAGAGDVLGSVAAAMIFTVAARRIAALTREIRQSRLKDPTDPPDFSHLGDGSQRVRDLEAMTQPGEVEQGNG